MSCLVRNVPFHTPIEMASVADSNRSQVDIPLTQLAATYRFEEWRTTRARFKSSRVAFRAKGRVGRTW